MNISLDNKLATPISSNAYSLWQITAESYRQQGLQTVDRALTWDVNTPHKHVFIIRGIGFRAHIAVLHAEDVENKQITRCLVLRVGHSSPIQLFIPNWIGVRISKKDRKLVIWSQYQTLLSDFAQKIYKLRTPSVYTGRGIRYKKQPARRKLGKKDIRKGRAF